MKRTAAEYAVLLDLLDQALSLPVDSRAAWIEKLSDAHGALRDTLRRLLLETPAGTVFEDMSRNVMVLARDAAAQSAAPALEFGRLIGPYRLLRELGRGGMGSVWLAERTDGIFERQVALKLPHLTRSSRLAERLVRERSILAGLEHPGIARLYEGGVTGDGRPYMALEYVVGDELLAYCESRHSTLAERLRLFSDICAAVSYAHAHLVVHRDLKPANILVTAGGQVKLLDFGIAKLLEPNVVGDASRTASLSAAYAAPEQMAGNAVTTATDVYALGVTLFQLLSGRLPWLVSDLPIAAAVRRLEQVAPRLSSAMTVKSQVAARQVRGDLDAIVAKALRPDPGSRYPDARTLGEDIGRFARHEPVRARLGAHSYVVLRFLRRRWLALSATAGVFLALAIGSGVALWQAHRAQVEAARATATKDFLVSLFRASDPRIAQDKPRSELTAKQILDIGSSRIEKEFAAQPELQIELLGVAAEIYDFLSDEERYAATQKRRLELARGYYGPSHPIVIRGLLDEADAACVRQDYAKAAQILAEVDVLLRTSHQDGSFLRGLWWREQGRVLLDFPDAQGKRLDAFNRALAMFSLYGPNTSEYANALDMAAIDANHRGDLTEAKRLNEQALAVAERVPQRDDANIAIMMSNLARKEERLGFFQEAEAYYERAEAQELKTFGAGNMTYWFTRAHHGFLLCSRGRRDAANLLFASIVEGMPKDWKRDDLGSYVRQLYAACLAAEGRAREAIPVFEESYHAYLEHPGDVYNLRDLLRRLGDAYDQAGRLQDARRMLSEARDEVIKNEAPDAEDALRVRERWGRFLLDHSAAGQPELDAAETEFNFMVAQSRNRPWIEAVQAHAGLARVALARGDAAHGLTESRKALGGLDQVRGLYDVRVQPQIWLVYSAALRGNGDAPAARLWADKALQASRRYDVESADSIRLADAALVAAMWRIPPHTL